MHRRFLSRRARRAISAVAFLLLFLFLFQLLSGRMRGNQYTAAAIGLYDEPKHSIDVLFMGSSHMLNAVSPLELWEEYGLVSNNFAQNSQVLPMTYYAVKEALRFQTPKVIVLDIYKIVQDCLYETEAALHYNLDCMHFGLPKYQAIFDLVERERQPEYLIDLITYHTRWKELFQEEVQEPVVRHKGTELLFSTYQPYAGWTVVPEQETIQPPEVAVEYLKRIVDLCREEGVELLLTAVPFTTPEEDELGRQQMVNAVGGYAQDWGVPFVNMMYQDLGLDYSQDMANMYHVNYWGMQKVSHWLGAYLLEHYDLPDRRGEAAYQGWNQDLAEYRSWLAGMVPEQQPGSVLDGVG